MTAKEKLLKEAPGWSEAQATAALRVIDAQAELTAHFEAESKLSASESAESEDRWALANALEAIREERW